MDALDTVDIVEALEEVEIIGDVETDVLDVEAGNVAEDDAVCELATDRLERAVEVDELL